MQCYVDLHCRAHSIVAVVQTVVFVVEMMKGDEERIVAAVVAVEIERGWKREMNEECLFLHRLAAVAVELWQEWEGHAEGEH